MNYPDSIQSHLEHAPDSLNYDYADGGELLCGDCGGTCKTHTWDKRQQVFIGECCRRPASDLLPANYGVRQVAILEGVAGITDGRALVEQALSHLRFARMQSTDPLMVHVQIAERLLEQLRRAA